MTGEFSLSTPVPPISAALIYEFRDEKRPNPHTNKPYERGAVWCAITIDCKHVFIDKAIFDQMKQVSAERPLDFALRSVILCGELYLHAISTGFLKRVTQEEFLAMAANDQKLLSATDATVSTH